VSPGFGCGVVAKSVVGETAIIVIASFEEGGAVTVPAAVGGVSARNTPLDVSVDTVIGTVVLAAGATDV